MINENAPATLAPLGASRALWTIVYGDYELIVDRRALTYRLTETKTNTVWSENLSLGWVELESRETGEITRHDFGSLQCVSVSEKSGPQGKRILFGLDIHGVPIDLYLICSQREIQLQIEANRDCKTHKIAGFGLLPELCAIPNGAEGWLVLPLTGGAYLRRPVESLWRGRQSAYQTWLDTSMPFVAATQRIEKQRETTLLLITDSAYSQAAQTTNALNFQYQRDPERRRLDLRCHLLPDGGPIEAALAYREKLIADNNHVTLRRKMRERPLLHDLLMNPRHDFYNRLSKFSYMTDTINVTQVNRWEKMESRLAGMRQAQESGNAVWASEPVDWAAIAADLWGCETGDVYELPPYSIITPALAAVYRDCVIPLIWFAAKSAPRSFLRALLNLAFPHLPGLPDAYPEAITQRCNVLGDLYRLTFSAFLTAHRFLTPDYSVEEAIYSDKTRVVVNQSETDVYETEEFALPPLGFHVRHSQMEAHDALRLGDEIFLTRAWRIRRSRDGRPLEQSTDIERQEFPVS